MLCPACENLRFSLDLSRKQQLVFHPSFSTLQSSSESGCHVCRMVYTSLRTELGSTRISEDHAVLITTVEDKGFLVTFEPKSEAPKGDPPLNITEVDVKVLVERLEIPRKLTDIFIEVKDLADSDTGSHSSFRIASAWLAECMENHHYCKMTEAAGTILPNRVIDVGLIDECREPYLFETYGRIQGSYVTLSHCWGDGNSHIKTTHKNLDLHKSKITLDSLPKTFKDAVQVVRELGLRYLWIDSLCIIQDDKTDWENEAVLMGRYYKNSLLTIAATHGKNSEAGLFKDRDPLSTRPCELEVRAIGQPNGTRQKVYIYTLDMSFQVSKSSLSSVYTPLPLYQRAWVLQEQLLSRRTLSYSNSGISWRCQTMRFDERPPLAMSIDDLLNDRPRNLVTRRGDPREIESMILETQQNWVFPRQINSVGGDGRQGKEWFHRRDCCRHERDHFFDNWAGLVTDYTSRGMTRQSDRLVAIRGVADEFAALTSAEYIAGVWNGPEYCFTKGLLWYISSPGKRQLEVAPSWSWASVQREIHWTICLNFEQSAEFVNIKSSETVAQSKGAITLRSNVRLGIVGGDGKIQVAKWPDVVCDEDLVSDVAASLSIGPTPHWEDVLVTMDETVAANVTIYFVELATTQVPAKKEQLAVHALVLVKDEERKGLFYRVGLSMWKQDFWRHPSISAPDLDTPAATKTVNERVQGERGQIDIRLRRIEVTIT